MGALIPIKKTFEQRIAEFNQQIEAETEGEYSVQATASGYVELQYKGQGLLQIQAQGQTYKQLYELICNLVKAFLLHNFADYQESFREVF